VTRSGYLRVNFQTEEEHDFLGLLENLGLIDLELMKSALLEDPIRVEESYEVYFEKRFDRSEFFAEFKKQKDEEKRLKIEKQKLKRQELLDKSKNISEKESE
jgi:hypothetical protein